MKRLPGGVTQNLLSGHGRPLLGEARAKVMAYLESRQKGGISRPAARLGEPPAP